MKDDLLQDMMRQMEETRTGEELNILADQVVSQFEELAGMIDWYLKTNINLEQSKRDIAMRIADNAEQWAIVSRKILEDSEHIRDIVDDIRYWMDNKPDEEAMED